MFWIFHIQNQGAKQLKLSEDLKNLLSRMLSFNPCNRPSIEDIMNHPWMRMQTYKYSKDSFDDVIETEGSRIENRIKNTSKIL